MADQEAIPRFEDTQAIEPQAPQVPSDVPKFEDTLPIQQAKDMTGIPLEKHETKYDSVKNYLTSFFASEGEGKEKSLAKDDITNVMAGDPLRKKETPNETKEARTIFDALEAGFDTSVTGLMHDKPDMVLPEHAPMFYRIASQVGQLAGDVPAMVAGGVGGGAAGVAMTLNPLGAVAGAGAGAFALPEGIRTALMEGYEKGEVQSFSDFWERAAAVTINSAKAGVTGAATALVGPAIAAEGLIAAPIIKTAAQLMGEVATMTTVGAAMEGKVPEPEAFMDGALLVGAFHGATHVAGKLRKTYGKTGISPVEVFDKTQTDPSVKQDLISNNIEIPRNSEFGALKNEALPEKFETTKPLKEPNPDLSAETNSILSKVREKGPKEGKKLTVDKLYTDFVDKLDPINEATKTLSAGKELKTDENPYILSRVVPDAKAKAKYFFEKGTFDFAEKKDNGISLKETLKSVESPEALDAYLVSKRVLEKEGQGLSTGFDVETAKKVVEEHGAKYEKAAQEVTSFQNRVLEYVRDSGRISKEQYSKMVDANKDYVPFKRLLDDAEGGSKGTGKNSSLKKFSGSESDIQSPIMSIVENTVELMKTAEENRAKTALIDLVKEAGGGSVPTERSSGQLVSEVSTKNKVGLKENEFMVYEDGVKKVYETTPELAEAINRLGGDATSTNLAFKIMHGITTAKRFGITFTPDFIVKNFERDLLTASTFSKGGLINPMDVFSAMGDLIKKNEHYYDWLKSGGANGAFLELNDKYVRSGIFKEEKATNFLGAARNVIDKGIGMARVAAELSEQTLRLAEFKKVRSLGGSLTEGGIASREITVDFQRVGAKVAAMNSITAFMNVGIQGLDRTVRAVKDNPTAVVAKSAMLLTAPSILLWWANKDDQRVQSLQRWEKDNFWIIATDDWKDADVSEARGLPEYMVKNENGKTQINKGTLYRIPKPQELGMIFATMPERIMEKYFTDNPRAMKDFDESLLHLITPNFVPDAVAPAVEQFFNKSFFTGRAIVPQHLSDVMPEYQFVDYTSETAKALGKLVATVDKESSFASPLVIQNYITSWSGALGSYATQLADKALVKAGLAPEKVKPSDTLKDIPFIGSFVVRFPSINTSNIEDFYQSYGEAEKVSKTIKHLEKNGDMDMAEKEMQDPENQEKMMRLTGVKEALSAQSQLVRAVNKNPDIKPEEKRQIIDGAYLMMNEIAKTGNKMTDDFKKTLKNNSKEGDQ